MNIVEGQSKVRIIERKYHDGMVRYVIQKQHNFFGWTKWLDASYDSSYETLDEAEDNVEEWLPKPRPIEKVLKLY